MLFLCFSSYAQEKSANALLAEAAREITASNYDYAIKLLNESTALARKDADSRAMSKSLMALGDAYNKNGNVAEAVKSYLNALAELKKLKDNLEVTQVSKELGKLYLLQGKPEFSLKYYTEGAAMAKQLNNEILNADCP